MERFLFLVFILAFFGAASCGTVSPEEVKDTAENVADAASKITWGPLPEGKAYSQSDKTTTGLEVMYKMIDGFLGVIQPNPFPYDIFTAALFAGDMSAITGDYMKLVMYFLGFAICFAFGILFFIIMPIVGCCFCCCRLCNNCGGKKVHIPKDISNCHRITFTVFVFVMAAMIGIPAACSLVANEQTSKNLNNLATVATNQLDDMVNFLDNVILQAKHASLTNYNFTTSVVKRDLDNIDVILGEKIRDEMAVEMKVDDVEKVIVALQTSLQKLNTVFNDAKTQQATFNTEQGQLKTDLGPEKTMFGNTKTKAQCSITPACTSKDETKLDIDSDPTKVLPPIDTTKINSAASNNLTKQYEDSMKDFNDLPTTVKTDTATMRKDLMDQLTGQYDTVNNAVKGISDIVSNLGMLDDAKASIKTYTGYITPYDKYRWYGSIGLGCLLLLISLLQFLGAGIGACTYKPKCKPHKRSCCSNAGGNLLLASVGFMFIFSWILMLLSSILFMLGGNLHVLVCKPLLDPTYEIYKKLFDIPTGSPFGDGYMLAGMILQNKSVELTVHGCLDGCKKNGSAYSVLKLDKLLDLDSATDYKKNVDIDDQLKNKNGIDLTGIKVLSPSLEKDLDDFHDALNPDFTLMLTELNKPTTKTDLKAFADDLTTLSGTVLGLANADLVSQAASLNSIYNGQYQKAHSARIAFRDSVQTIQDDKSKVQSDITNVKTEIKALETYLATKSAALVDKKIVDYSARLFGTMDAFVAETLRLMKEEVGKCTPLWNLYEAVFGTILCGSIVDTINGIWFCYGWATFMFIPAIIFAVKLNKYLRKCKKYDPDEEKKKKEKKEAKKNKKKNRVAPSPEN